MNLIRIDHMVEQYVWTLENDGVFMPKAKHEVERGNFNMFRRLCSSYIQETRRALGEAHTEGINGYEWSFLYLEMWVRLGGFNILMSNLYYDKDVRFQIDRLTTAGFCVTRDGIKPNLPLGNPCAEIKISEPQPCTLAPEPEKEIPVSKKIIIQNVTFINNVDVTTMNDAQLIDAIKTIEAEITDLKAVKTKSVKITAKIAEAQATLTKVVEILDSRP